MPRKKNTPSQESSELPEKKSSPAPQRGNRSSRSTRVPGVPLPKSASTNPADDDALVKEEPDEPALAQSSEEWAELSMDDPLEILEDPSIAMELSEDPVRLYLKEIGQIHLLDADSEFRLAARIEAERRIVAWQDHTEPGGRGGALPRSVHERSAGIAHVVGAPGGRLPAFEPGRNP